MTSPHHRADGARPPTAIATARSRTVLEHAASALDELATMWPRLEEALEPGTRRRWTERQQDVAEDGLRIPTPAATRCPDCRSVRLTTEPQVVTDQDDQPTGQVLPGRPYCPRGCDEQPNRPGYTASPTSDGALSTLVSVGTDLAWLEDNVREELGFTVLDEQDPVQEAHRHRAGLPRLTGRDPRAALGWLQGQLPALVEHADLARHVSGEATRLARTVRHALGDIEDIHPIKAPCPICGCMSLRAFPERELIVCVNDRCACTDPDCKCDDTERPRRHRWVREQWDWLAQVLGVDLDDRERTA